MTDSPELAAIRARVKRNYNDGVSDNYEQVGSDRRALLRMLDEARTEATFWADRATNPVKLAERKAEMSALRAERDEARADNERLREAMERASDG